MPADSSYIFQQIVIYLGKFYNSTFFAVVKFIIAIYITVLFADILIILIQRLRGNVRTMILGMNIPNISVKKMRKRWQEIDELIRSENISKYKIAVIKADKIADEIVEGIGFKGENMTERLEKVQPGQIDNLDDLKKAHETRNRIIQDPSYHVDQETASNTVKIYEEFLKNLEYL